jgi:hypothetical protein
MLSSHALKIFEPLHKPMQRLGVGGVPVLNELAASNIMIAAQFVRPSAAPSH